MRSGPARQRKERRISESLRRDLDISWGKDRRGAFADVDAVRFPLINQHARILVRAVQAQNRVCDIVAQLVLGKGRIRSIFQRLG